MELLTVHQVAELTGLSVALEGRLCPSGHVNPPDASLVFCGECGKPREKEWGPGSLPMPYLVGLAMFLVTTTLAALWLLLSEYDPLVNAIVALAVVVLGFRLAFRIVSPWVRNLIGDLLSLLFSMLNPLFRLVLGTSLKGGGKK